MVTAIESNIDWEDVAARMATADCEPNDDESGYVRRVYLGTVFNWYPSSKFYTPWACGNLEPCPTCQGKGDLPNPAQDDVVHAAAQALAAFLTKELIAAYGFYAERRWDPELHMDLNDVRAIQTLSQREITCTTCDGCGSEEAYHDDLWREAAEAEAEARGYSVENGEGDPCDLFIVEYFDPEDENLPK